MEEDCSSVKTFSVATWSGAKVWFLVQAILDMLQYINSTLIVVYLVIQFLVQAGGSLYRLVVPSLDILTPPLFLVQFLVQEYYTLLM